MGKRGKKKSTLHPLAVVMLFTLIPLAPMFYNKFILYFGTPDIQYVKAKILRILAGQIYADPVSGYLTTSAITGRNVVMDSLAETGLVK